VKKGISLPIDFLYILIFFLLVAVVVIGVLVFMSKDIIESIKSGKVYEYIESMLKRAIGK